MKNNFTLFILLLILSGTSFGQNKKVLVSSAGITFQTLKDQGHSPLIYAGKALTLGFAFRNQDSLKMDVIHYQFGNTNMTGRLEKPSEYHLNLASRKFMNFSVNRLRKINTGGVNLYVGGITSFFYDFLTYSHQANNLTGYELNLSLSPSIYVEKPLSKALLLSVEADFPLIGYNVRNEALGLFPMKNFDVDMKEIFLGGKIVTLNKVQQLHAKTTFHWTIKNKKINLFYNFFGGINTVSERRTYKFHQIGLELPLTLNKK